MLELKQSSLYQAIAAEDIAEGEARGIAKGVAQGLAQGVAQGLAQGKLDAERELCLELVKKHHRGLLKKAAPLIQDCDDTALLRKWILGTSDPDCGALGRLLDHVESPKTGR